MAGLHFSYVYKSVLAAEDENISINFKTIVIMKHLLVLFMLLCSATAYAQDVIVKKDGSTVVCRVVELTSSEIVYKKWSDLNGSNYVMNRSDASSINYESGKKVSFAEAGENLYSPGNQNDGVQQYNDRALLQLDNAANSPYKKVKRLRTIGWIGGGSLVAAGIVIFAIYGSKEIDDALPFALPCIGAGVLGTTSVLLIANYQKKKLDKTLQATSIYKREVNFSDGTSLSVGFDMLSIHTDTNRMFGNNTLGLGLRYNF